MKKSIKELSPQLRNRAALKRYQQGGMSNTGFPIEQITDAGLVYKELPDELRKQKHLRQAESFLKVPKQYHTKLLVILEDILKSLGDDAVIDYGNDTFYKPLLKYVLVKSPNIPNNDGYEDRQIPIKDTTTFSIHLSITPSKGERLGNYAPGPTGGKINYKNIFYSKDWDRRDIPFTATWYYKNPGDSKPTLVTKMGFLKNSKLNIPSSVTNKLIRFIDTLKAEIVKNPKSDKLKDTSYSDWANADDKDRYLETKLTNKMKLNESLELEKLEDAIKMFQDKIKKQGNVTNARDEEHLENLIRVYKEMGGKNVKESVLNENQEEILKKILRNIDKYIQRTGKGQKHVNDLRSKIEAKLMAINPNVTKSSALKTFKGTIDSKNESKDITLEDIKKLLELIKEEKGKASKKSKPKQEQPQEQPVDSSKAVSDLLDSSVGKTFKQRLSRMGSNRDKADAIIQLLVKLPGMSIADVRRSVSNKFRTKD